MVEAFKLFGSIMLNGGKEVADELGNVDKKGKTASERLKKFGEGMKSVGTKLTAGVTLPLIGIGGATIKMASDVEEMRGKFSVVFAEASQDVEDWATVQAEAVGRSRYALMGYLSENQNMLVGMGMAREEATQMSKDMTQLGVDLASFNNLAEADALKSLQSAISGNHGASQALGAVLNENTLAVEMERMGLQGKFQDLDEGTKMQVRYNSILAQSTDAVGDAERTSDSFANQMRRAGGYLNELGVDIGNVLLPYVTKLVQGFNKIIKVFQGASDEQKTMAVIIGLVVAIIPPLITALGFIAIAIGSIGLPVAGLIAGIVALIGIFTGLMATNEEFRDTVMTIFGTVKDFVLGIVEDIVSFVKERVQVFVDFWNENSEQIMLAWENAFNMVLGIIEFIAPLIGFLVGGAIEGIKNMFGGLMTFIQGLIQIFTGIFTGDWSMMWEGLKNVLLGAVQFIWGLMNVTFLGRIVKIITAFGRMGLNLFKNFFTGAKTVFTNIRTWITNSVTRVKDAITGAFTGARNRGLSIIDSMKAGVSGAFTSIKRIATQTFNNIRDAIFKPINTARDKVKTAIDKITGFFSGLKSKLKIEIPKISVPSFKVHNWSINPANWVKNPPRIGIQWNARGGVFDEPTVMQGLGENGREAIVPLQRPQYFRPFAEAIASQMPNMAGGLGSIAEFFNIEVPVTLNGKVIAKAIANPVNEILERKRQTASRMKGAGQ